ncbi:MAG: helix-turn-helix domain-containing protein [Betaproteobacteria bacterium]|nr:helix-turn-helix domain-containing protein [Betaproteobacteria bacterium]MBK8864717.1 helix-turn-helix domain-containing protein [Betaproteobacteria bacterium]
MSLNPASTRHVEPTPACVERSGLTQGGLQQLVVPDQAYSERLLALANGRRTVRRGAPLYRSGDRLSQLYVVDSGLFKTCLLHEDGRSQVTGFHLSGDWLGLDGIVSDSHHSDAVALEDAQVCTIDYNELEALLHEFPDLRRQFQRILSREIVRSTEMMQLLGGMCAEKRVATFLLDLTQRLRERGGPETSLVLPMTREEIGSCLGLKLETVSRMFSKLRKAGVLDVTQRHVQLVDVAALQQIAHG